MPETCEREEARRGGEVSLMMHIRGSFCSMRRYACALMNKAPIMRPAAPHHGGLPLSFLWPAQNSLLLWVAGKHA